jgi:hypothetical protein
LTTTRRGGAGEWQRIRGQLMTCHAMTWQHPLMRDFKLGVRLALKARAFRFGRLADSTTCILFFDRWDQRGALASRIKHLRPNPPLPVASAQRPSAAARAPREPVHTRQPLAGGLHPSAPRRPPPRRPRNSRAAPQPHPGTRRTFHEPRRPPGTDAERAWQGRAIQTPVVAPTPQRLAKDA